MYVFRHDDKAEPMDIKLVAHISHGIDETAADAFMSEELQASVTAEGNIMDMVLFVVTMEAARHGEEYSVLTICPPPLLCNLLSSQSPGFLRLGAIDDLGNLLFARFHAWKAAVLVFRVGRTQLEDGLDPWGGRSRPSISSFMGRIYRSPFPLHQIL